MSEVEIVNTEAHHSSGRDFSLHLRAILGGAAELGGDDGD